MARATLMLLTMFLFSLFLSAMGYDNVASTVLRFFQGDPTAMPFIAKFAVFTTTTTVVLGIAFFSNTPIIVQAGIALFSLITYPYTLLSAEQMPTFVKTLVTGVWIILWLTAALDVAGRGNI